MCICTLLHTVLTQLDYVLLTSALDPLLWKTVCDCLYLMKPWHLTAKLLIRITRELCSPCSYQSAAPVVVNTCVPPRSPSANSTQDAVVSSSRYSLMFHSVGDFKVNNLNMHKRCMQLPFITHSQLFSRFHRKLT